MKKIVKSRRNFIEGLGGLIAVPIFESLLPSRAWSATAQDPKRLLIMTFPNGTYGGTQIGGKAMGAWYPAAQGVLNPTTLPMALTGLSPNTGDFSIVGGLYNTGALRENYEERKIPTPFSAHARSLSSFLTCCPQTFTVPTDPVKIGPSMDQVIADHLTKTHGLRTHSLVMSPSSFGENPDQGNVDYVNSLSYRRDKAISPIRSPQQIFDLLFPHLVPVSGKLTTAQIRLNRQSILDHSKQSVDHLKRKLSSTDQVKLNDYLEGVRSMEIKVAQIQGPSCASFPQRPSDNFGQASNIQLLDSHFVQRVDLMIDLIISAFQCDLTRVATLMWAPEILKQVFQGVVLSSDRIMNASLSGNAHIDCAHHNEDLAKIHAILSINRFQVSFLKKILDRMKAKIENDGTMLDNSVVLFGSSLGDGSRHEYFNLPLIVAGGRGLGLKPGKYSHFERAPLANLHLTLMQKFGLSLSSFGSYRGTSTGTLNI